jgi:hypothetical protein
MVRNKANYQGSARPDPQGLPCETKPIRGGDNCYNFILYNWL